MTSPRRRQGKPVRSVDLKVVFKGDRLSLSKIKQAVPQAKWEGGALEVWLTGAEPLRVAEEAKVISDKVKQALGGGGREDGSGRRKPAKTQKDFKQ